MNRWNEGFLQRVCLNERRMVSNEGEYLKGERDEREEKKKKDRSVESVGQFGHGKERARRR